MKYATIRKMDISNGTGIGVSLFVQGCHFHCKNCFNSSTWDFNGGKEWNDDIKNKFFNYINKEYIDRISILGGEPLADENIKEINSLINELKSIYPDKKIWLYSGYTWEEIFPSITKDLSRCDILRQNTINKIDVLVDGLFIDELKDLSLKFRGSKNQRIIDVQKTLLSRDVSYNIYEYQEVT